MEKNRVWYYNYQSYFKGEPRRDIMATASFNTVFKVGRKHQNSFDKVLAQKSTTLTCIESKFIKASECAALTKAFKR